VSDPETKIVGAPPDTEPERDGAATGRRWGVSLALIVVGLAVLAFGLAAHWWPAAAVGAVLILVFGCIAAGARETSAGAGPVRANAKFNVPPAPEGKRRIYLPRGWRR
jgi:hypothetical protein